MDNLPLLSLMLLTLPAGAALIWLLPRPGQARYIAAGTALVALAIALAVVFRFDPAISGFQLVEQIPWIPNLGVNYLVGVDGFSVLFLPLTALLFLGAVLTSFNQVSVSPKAYFSLLLLEGAATLGIFCVLDTLFFFMLWEFSIIPIYFLVSLWGVGPNRKPAANKYALLMLAGGLLLLFAFLLLALHALDGGGGGSPFDLRLLLGMHIPATLQMTVFALLLAGFGVKAPLVPLHTWLPQLANEGPVAVTALIAGLKIGAFGLIRFAFPLAPEAAHAFQWLLVGLGSAGILYGAVVALAQTNLRPALAYLGVSHVGLVILGLATFRQEGIAGAVFELLNFTVIAGGSFLVLDFLRQRVGTTDVTSLGGAMKHLPWLGSFFLLLGLAALGLPGTSGFPAEFLIILAALQTHTGAGLAALAAMVIGAGCFMVLYQRAFFGPVKNPVLVEAEDLRMRERMVVIAFALVVLVTGFYPALFLDIIESAGQAWIARLSP
ncbi:MAG: NADH-quinone oxidoreductase subunit M [Gammaproteobacteria bacterium]|nr:NADH-quinone oxidoreductase subunit M [Gammaproteobacteria bacterium]